MNKVFLIALGIAFVACSEDSANKNVQKQDVIQKEIVEKEMPKQEPIKKEILKEVETITKPVAKVVTAVKTGQDIFKKCIACHGQSAEKKALGKSQVIKGWDSAKIMTALNGYKDGTYGGAMKGIMKGQASVLSDDDIKLVAEYISKL